MVCIFTDGGGGGGGGIKWIDQGRDIALCRAVEEEVRRKAVEEIPYSS